MYLNGLTFSSIINEQGSAFAWGPQNQPNYTSYTAFSMLKQEFTLISLENNIIYIMKNLNFIMIQFEYSKINTLDQYLIMHIFIGKYKRLTWNRWFPLHQFTGKVQVHKKCTGKCERTTLSVNLKLNGTSRSVVMRFW